MICADRAEFGAGSPEADVRQLRRLRPNCIYFDLEQ
jgi:hypothetical protein